MNKLNRKAGFTLIELLVVVSIVVIVSAVVSPLFSEIIRKNDLENQLKFIKATVLKAKANAIETNCAVRFTIDPADGRLLVVRDQDRDGDFEDTPAIVLGLAADKGVLLPYDRNIEVYEPPSPTGLDFWFQSGVFVGKQAAIFPGNGFIVLPNGQLTTFDLAASGGTFFFSTRSDDHQGAVHITSMGEVRMALKAGEKEGTDGWEWRN